MTIFQTLITTKQIFKQINERELEALAYAGLGDIYDILQDYEKSITYYENFLLIADKEKQTTTQ